MMRMPFVKQISWYLIVAMFVIGVAPRLDAAIAPSEVIASSQVDRAADLAQIQRVLEMKVVKERLDRLGFTADEIRARVDGLSDHQIHQFAGQIDDMRVGGDAGGVIIALLVIIVVVIVVLLVTGNKVIVTK
jgi:hypothetical protein